MCTLLNPACPEAPTQGGLRVKAMILIPSQRPLEHIAKCQSDSIPWYTYRPLGAAHWPHEHANNSKQCHQQQAAAHALTLHALTRLTVFFSLHTFRCATILTKVLGAKQDDVSYPNTLGGACEAAENGSEPL